jgi:uncharacterized protein YjbI with pentapeptide repeats
LAGEEISLPNIEHEKILASGVEEWNSWRERQLDGVLHREDAPRPNLSGANLQGRDLNGVNFSGVLLYRTDLRRANLQEADLTEADLQWADLRGADLMLARMDRVNLEHANLSDGATLTGAQLGQARLGRTILEGADLIGADLGGADLRHADLRGAILYDADLSLATLVGTRLEGALLNGCRVDGASVWSVQLDEKTQQQGLIITPKPGLLPPEQAAELQQDIQRIVSEQGSLRPDWHQSETVAVIDEPTVTTDDLQIAQFLLSAKREQTAKWRYRCNRQPGSVGTREFCAAAEDGSRRDSGGTKKARLRAGDIRLQASVFSRHRRNNQHAGAHGALYCR